jgi:hypothetical protein
MQAAQHLELDVFLKFSPSAQHGFSVFKSATGMLPPRSFTISKPGHRSSRQVHNKQQRGPPVHQALKMRTPAEAYALAA